MRNVVGLTLFNETKPGWEREREHSYTMRCALCYADAWDYM